MSENEKPKTANLTVKRIYIKDLSFEAPSGMNVFQDGWKPKVGQDLNTQINKVDDEHFEVILNMTVTVANQEDKTAFIVEVHQAGLFQITGIEGGQLQHLLSTMCPNMLFPYLRECIDSTAARGGFPPLMLPPINFEAVYAQAIAEAKEKKEQGAVQ